MNQRIIAAFEELHRIYDILGETHKANAYRRAVRELRLLNSAQESARASRQTSGRASVRASGPSPGRMSGLTASRPGIGKTMVAKIREFTSTGHIVELDDLRKSPRVRAFVILSKILGVGPATAQKWYDLGVNSLATLHREVMAHRITLNKMQYYGIKYYADLNMRIPRAEVTALGGIIRRAIVQLDPEIIFEIAGSYRRGTADSGDIDILISNPRAFSDAILSHIAATLKRDANYIDALSAGPSRLTFLYKSPVSQRVRQIDILNIAYRDYHAALLYFTGDGEFNEEMRGYAKRKGFRLNQLGLHRVLKNGSLRRIATNSEEDIFAALGLKYIAPAHRTLAGFSAAIQK
jgi:DNA polymerase/3'-5' exonuclease PolX